MENKEDLETFDQIIAESNKKLSTLKILSNFFNHTDLIAILIRTKVIHNLFEGNKNLDIHKLDLFHIQYTNSLIELFQKLKKSKEQKYLLVSDEIYLNEDFIVKLRAELDIIPFTDELRDHARNVAKKIEELYRIFTDGSTGSFDWSGVSQFINKRSGEFYRDLTEKQYQNLVAHQHKPIYTNSFVTFERKLLGKLNIQKFRIKFLCGFKYETEEIEVYEFLNSNDKFIFINDKKSFYLIDNTQLNGLDLSKNESNKKQIIDQLVSKNLVLKDVLSSIKTSMPKEVEAVLDSYMEKISGVEFLDDLQNVDEQTNILKAMLNINIK